MLYILNIEEVLEFLDDRQEILTDLGFSKSSIVVRAFGPMLVSLDRPHRADTARFLAGHMHGCRANPVEEITETINRHLEQRTGSWLVKVKPSGPEVGSIIRIISDTSVLLGEAVVRQIGTLPTHTVIHQVLANGLIIAT